MSVTFTKLFSSITESTVWCEPASTRLVWITMLAMADRKGRVWASIPGLANRARVPVPDARIAVERLLSPDPDSRTPDHDGKRIEPIDGGWRLINYYKYRDIRDEDDERDRAAERKRLERERKRANVTVSHGMSQGVLPGHGNEEAEVEAEADPEADSKAEAGRSKAEPRASRLPATWTLPPEWEQWAIQERGWSAGQARKVADGFRDHWIAKAGKDARKIDWEATWRNWVRNQSTNGRKLMTGGNAEAIAQAKQELFGDQEKDITGESKRI